MAKNLFGYDWNTQYSPKKYSREKRLNLETKKLEKYNRYKKSNKIKVCYKKLI